MLVEMDDAVGELLSRLKSSGMWENSLVLTASDNGGMTRWAVSDAHDDPAWPASAGDNFPFRGSKATLFEGGVRAIGFLSGGHVPPAARGSTFDGLTHAVDLTATMLRRGRVQLSRMDGKDVWPSIAFAAPAAGEANDAAIAIPPVRSHVPINLIHNGTDFSGVVFRDGSLKLILGRVATPWDEAIRGWSRHGLYPPVELPPAAEPSPLLFNLTVDPTERHPLPPDAFSDLVREGKALLAQYLSGTDPERLGYMEPQPNTPDLPRCLPGLHGGVWAPFLRDEEDEGRGDAARRRRPERQS